LELVLK
jgi:hypothetical protein